jgi:hypothetical protein
MLSNYQPGTVVLVRGTEGHPDILYTIPGDKVAYSDLDCLCNPAP